MDVRSILSIASGAFLLSGCAIHPLPEDFSRNSTVDIVQKIRCEAKFAISEQIAVRLDRSGIAESIHLAQRLRDGEDVISLLKERHFTQRDFETVKKYRAVVIGYDFSFQITEDNGGSGDATFSLPFSTGSFTLGVSSGLTKKRESDRDFEFTETFEEAARRFDCGVQGETRKNWKYPITGNIGLANTIDTFIQLSDLDDDVSDYTDRLTFTTTLSGSVSPTISLNPIADRLKLTKLALSVSASRSDIHEVTVALTLLKPSAPKKPLQIEIVGGLPAVVTVPGRVPQSSRFSRGRFPRSQGRYTRDAKRRVKEILRRKRAPRDEADSLIRQFGSGAR